MSVLAAVKTLLEADATLLATATGGVYDYDETGRDGISRTAAATSAAFDANGIVKPCVLLKSRSETPDGILADDAERVVSAREMLEAWYYADSGFAAINTMKARVYTLLHATQVSGSFIVYWQGDIRFPVRDPDLDANVERSDYLARVLKS
jgi:hypothetical protein